MMAGSMSLSVSQLTSPESLSPSTFHAMNVSDDRAAKPCKMMMLVYFSCLTKVAEASYLLYCLSGGISSITRVWIKLTQPKDSGLLESLLGSFLKQLRDMLWIHGGGWHWVDLGHPWCRMSWIKLESLGLCPSGSFKMRRIRAVVTNGLLPRN